MIEKDVNYKRKRSRQVRGNTSIKPLRQKELDQYIDGQFLPDDYNDTRPSVGHPSSMMRYKKITGDYDTKAKKLHLTLINKLVEAYDKVNDKESFKFQDQPLLISEINKITGIRTFKELEKHLVSLMSCIVEFVVLVSKNGLQVPGNDGGRFHLLGSYVTVQSKKYIHISFDPQLEQEIKNPHFWAHLDLFTICNLKSKYSILLYQNLLQDRLDCNGMRTYTLEELKQLLEWPKGSWNKNYKFKKVVNDAVAEINSISNLLVQDPTWKKDGKSLNRVSFITSFNEKRMNKKEKQKKDATSFHEYNLQPGTYLSVLRNLLIPKELLAHKSTRNTLIAFLKVMWCEAIEDNEIEADYNAIYQADKNACFMMYFNDLYDDYSKGNHRKLKPFFDKVAEFTSLKYPASGQIKRKLQNEKNYNSQMEQISEMQNEGLAKHLKEEAEQKQIMVVQQTDEEIEKYEAEAEKAEAAKKRQREAWGMEEPDDPSQYY
jgi:replication initiator protein